MSPKSKTDPKEGPPLSAFSDRPLKDVSIEELKKALIDRKLMSGAPFTLADYYEELNARGIEHA